jgi:hypothetical protein
MYTYLLLSTVVVFDFSNALNGNQCFTEAYADVSLPFSCIILVKLSWTLAQLRAGYAAKPIHVITL